MILKGFLGPSNRTRALVYDNERSVNIYPEMPDAGSPKSELAQTIRPGLIPRWLLPAGPIRGLFYQDGRFFAVAGTTFCELFPNYTYTTHGNVALDANPATISSNGNGGFQLFITSGGLGYVFALNTDTFSQIGSSGFPSPVIMGDFCDGYSVVLKTNSNQFNLSELEDSLTWSGLSVAQTSESSDNKIALIVNHRELWLFGTLRTEVWVNTGDAGFPFQPIPGTLIEHGIIAPFSAKRLDNTIVWLGGDERGGNVVFRANGYTPERISTFGIENTLNNLARTSDAIAWTYQQAGHAFYCLYLPANDTTLVYDVSTNLWHEQGIWVPDEVRWIPHPGRCHAFAFDSRHFCGDRSSSIVYEMDLNRHYDELAA